MTEVLQVAAVLTTAAALATAGLALLSTRSPRTALAVLLDLLLAAGILRLAGDQSWGTLATVAAIVTIRRLAVLGFSASGRRRP